MLRALVVATSIMLALASTGCVGMGRGGMGVGMPCDCGDCGGCGTGEGIGHGGPFSGLRNWRRSLVCGGGCGEVYYGDYTNYPPDCCDPCDNQVANVTSHRRIRPVRATARLLTGLYGKRYCDDCETMGDDCCCDSGCSSGCDSGCDGCGVASSHGHSGTQIAKGLNAPRTIHEHGPQKTVAGKVTGSSKRPYYTRSEQTKLR